MGRKKTGFEWTEDEDDPERVERVDRTSRSQIKEEEAAIEQLLRDLLARPATERAHLPLGDDVLHELQVLADLPVGRAVKRQFGHVKGLLRALDVQALREALDGDTPRDVWLRQVQRWRNRLLDEGDEALQVFMEDHPAADRQRLRTLTRRASDDPSASRALFDALKEEMPEPDA